MRIKSKLLIVATLLIVAFSLNEVNAQTCTIPPTCAQLGYTMTKADCGDYPVVRCPFALTDDNQVYCGQETNISGGKISGENVGAILYGDGTVTKDILSDKVPIGIVFDEIHRFAVALTDVKADGSVGSESMKWSVKDVGISKEYCEVRVTHTGGIRSGTEGDGDVGSCGVDGRLNTDKILDCGNSCGETPAATACNLYAPIGCTADFCKQGEWFLPSMRDLYNIYQYKDLINTTLTSLGKDELYNDRYWSSTVEFTKKAWNFRMKDGYRSYDLIDAKHHVRPVVAF